jgi:hypothetical protein
MVYKLEVSLAEKKVELMVDLLVEQTASKWVLSMADRMVEELAVELVQY